MDGVVGLGREELAHRLRGNDAVQLVVALLVGFELVLVGFEERPDRIHFLSEDLGLLEHFLLGLLLLRQSAPQARRSQRHGDDQDEKHGELQPQAHPLHGRISSFGSMRTLGCVMLESGRQTRSLVIRGASSDVSHCSTSPKRKARVEQAATQAG